MRPPGKRRLVFDTSAAHCAAALASEDVPLRTAVEEMGRGQAERLIPLLQELLDADGCTWSELEALGVGVGPGNFTGIRISVAAARGLALGLGIPAVPISNFELMRDPTGPGANAAELVVLEAPRGAAYAQMFRYGRPDAPPALIDPAAPPDAFRRVDLQVTGFRAPDIAAHLGATHASATLTDLPRRLVKLLDWKLFNRHDTDLRPAPLYVRPADAAPPRDTAPAILP